MQLERGKEGWGLTAPAVVIERRKLRRPSERLPRQVHVVQRRRPLPPPREPKVNRVKRIPALAHPHEEVIRLHVPVHVPSRVDPLQPRDGLIRNHQHRLEREPPPAVREQVLEGGAQEVCREDVVLAGAAVPEEPGDADAADAAGHGGVDLCLVVEACGGHVGAVVHVV